MKRIKRYDQVDKDARVALYGSGHAGQEFKRRLNEIRPDVKIVFFIDSFKGGFVAGLPIIMRKDLREHMDEFDDLMLVMEKATDVSSNLMVENIVHSIVDPKLYSGVIDISDEFAGWLMYVNSGMMTRGNLYCFNCAIENLPSDNPIVEIGSFCGLSTNLISYYKRKHHAENKLITSDKWIFEGATEATLAGTEILHSDYRDFVKDSYIRNVKMFSKDDLPYTVEEISDDFFAGWSRKEMCSDIFGRAIRLGGAISFCFIDGNHSYEYVQRDFTNCDRFLESGGFILFDDSADGSGWEVCRVVKEVLESEKYELVMKNPNYLFRKN